jgi:hypothetical protein
MVSSLQLTLHHEARDRSGVNRDVVPLGFASA